MKMQRIGLAALALAALAIPGAANAANWEMSMYDNEARAPTWHYSVANSDPGNGDGCAASSSTWPDNGDWLKIFKVGEQYSGSTTRSRWVTLCKDGNYVTYELIISMNNCAFWICDIIWTSRTTRVNNVSESRRNLDGSVWAPGTMELEVTINPE